MAFMINPAKRFRESSASAKPNYKGSPGSVRETFFVHRAYEDGIFQIEESKGLALYGRCYFEDGTSIETIIADRKSEHDSTWTPWGHIHGNQIDVIEAETLLTINPGQPGCVESWGGHRVVSATNHGAFI